MKWFLLMLTYVLGTPTPLDDARLCNKLTAYTEGAVTCEMVHDWLQAQPVKPTPAPNPADDTKLAISNGF